MYNKILPYLTNICLVVAGTTVFCVSRAVYWEDLLFGLAIVGVTVALAGFFSGAKIRKAARQRQQAFVKHIPGHTAGLGQPKTGNPSKGWCRIIRSFVL